MRYSRLGTPLAMTAALSRCAPGDDNGTHKKAAPAPAAQSAPAPPPRPGKKKEEGKAAPKSSAATKVEAEGWILLGQEQANRKSDSDRITVDPEKRGVKELLLVV